MQLSRGINRFRGAGTGLSSVVLCSLFLAACSGIAGNPAQSVPTSTPIPTIPAVARPTYLVQRGDVQNIDEFTGRWQPRDQELLAFQTSGTIRRVLVKTGDTVSKGQLLADFQIDNLESNLASDKLNLQTALLSLQSGSSSNVTSVSDAEVALANANVSLQKTIQGNPWPSVESAKISLDGAQAGLLSAQRAYEDAISRAGNAASAVDGAYQALVSAQNQLRSAQAGYDSAAQNYQNYQFQIQTAKNQVIGAQLSLDQARSGASNPSGQQTVIADQLKIDQDQAQINQSSLYSDIQGEVLDVQIKQGDAVKAYDTVMTIGLPKPKEAVASLAIGDAQKLSVGMVGTCEVLNHPESAVQCVVRRIPLTSRDADQTSRIAASLEGLQTGQLVDVKMPLQVSQNVLWLPPSVIRTFQNRTFVVLQTPDGQRVADVTLGLQTTDRDEIKSGVNEGDIVIAP
ncbi:MAG TPA: biotin/lipoyl-binding protein [Aggregatilineales bacterium]|nr:biotin/lipoyl-binding protein [Aggregatilineales bacterium]